MVIKKASLKDYAMLTFFIVISGLYLLITDSILNNIISIVVLTFGASTVVRFNIAHPYVWYSVFFTLYTIGYPLLILFDATPVYNYGYTKELIILHWVALVTFLIVVSPRVIDIKSIRRNFKGFDCLLSKYLYYGLSFLVLCFIIFLSMQGYTSKNDLASTDSTVLHFGMRMMLIYILITCVELIKSVYKNESLNYKIIVFTFILLFFVFYFSAERDLIFRFLLVLFYIYYVFIYNKKHKGKLIIVISTLLLLIPISRSVKFLGMRGETYSLNNNFIVEFINSEFHTQSRNVQLLLNNGIYESYFEGKTFLTAILKLFGIPGLSPLHWFQENFYSTNSTGMGFSLVGEGYVNFGYVGIIIMFVIVGLIIKFIYLRSNKSIYNLVIYLMIIPISVYSIRADLFNFLTQFTKQVVLIIILLRIADEILSKERVRKKKYGLGDVNEKF